MKRISKTEKYKKKAHRFLRKYFPQQYYKATDEEVIKLGALLQKEFNAGMRHSMRFD